MTLKDVKLPEVGPIFFPECTTPQISPQSKFQLHAESAESFQVLNFGFTTRGVLSKCHLLLIFFFNSGHLLRKTAISNDNVHVDGILFLASRSEPSTMVVLKKLVSHMTENTVL